MVFYVPKDKKFRIHILCDHEIYAETKILNMSNLNENNLCIFMYQLQNNLVKGHFVPHLNREIHSYNTRVADKIHIDFSRTNMGKFASLRKSIHLYNSIPTVIKNSNTITIFKKRLKEYYIEAQISDTS